MAIERIRETFNDGVLAYGKLETQLNENGRSIGKAFNPVGTLPFRFLNARDSDYLAFGAMGLKLDLKVKTPTPPMLHNKSMTPYTVKINDQQYDVIKGDRDNIYLYFYLQRVGGDRLE